AQDRPRQLHGAHRAVRARRVRAGAGDEQARRAAARTVKRLLLSSASPGIRALPLAAGRDVAGLRVAFVPTAAGADWAAQPWVQEDRRQLDSLGCDVSILDLAVAEREEVRAALAGADGVFVGGGNTYLLLWHARRSGFADLVVPLVESGALVYAGT